MSLMNRIGLLTVAGGAILLGVGWLLLVPIAGCLGMDDVRKGSRKPLTEFEVPAPHVILGSGFSPSGKEVVVRTVRGDEAAGKGFLHFFDANSGKRLVTTSQPSRVIDFGFFADGKKLLTSRDGGGLHVFTGDEWEMVDTLDGPLIWQLRVFPDGKRAAVVPNGFAGPKVYDLEKKKVVSFPAPGKHPGFDIDISVEAVDVSPNGKQLVAALAAPRVEMYDIETVKVRASLKPVVDSGSFHSVRYSPDGKRIAAGYSNKEGVVSIHVWDAATHKLLHTCTAETMKRAVEFLRFTPDGKYILAGAVEHPEKPSRTLVFSTETGQLVRSVEREEGGGAGFVLSPDGTAILGYGKNGRVQKWDFAAIRKEFEAKEKK